MHLFYTQVTVMQNFDFDMYAWQCDRIRVPALSYKHLLDTHLFIACHNI